jgi:RimJ/RimL family protein N-acetyltransferase
MDRHSIKRSVDYDMHIVVFGTPERALEKGRGFYLMSGDEILCEVFAGPPAGGLVEVGVMTYDQHQGRGYATLTCAHLIQACEAAGYQTYWNCAKQNLASAAVARKLGYRTEREYKLVAWFKSK